jgi:hypothetical protein
MAAVVGVGDAVPVVVERPDAAAAAAAAANAAAGGGGGGAVQRLANGHAPGEARLLEQLQQSQAENHSLQQQAATAARAAETASMAVRRPLRAC